jgi:type IV pilus assembly protein PilE
MPTVKAHSENGFSLIELLVVTSILGILSATCLQIFIELRKRGYDGRAVEDLKHVATAEEAYFQTYEVYKSCATAAECAISLPSISKLSHGVSLEITATTTGFTGTSTHPTGSGIVYRWDSRRGGLLN